MIRFCDGGSCEIDVDGEGRDMGRFGKTIGRVWLFVEREGSSGVEVEGVRVDDECMMVSLARAW